MSVDRIRADLGKLGLRQCATRNGYVRSLVNSPRAASFAKGAEKSIGARAYQIAEDEIGPLIQDCRYDLIEFGVTDGEITFSENGSSARGQRLTKNAVVLPCSDVVGADAKRAIADP